MGINLLLVGDLSLSDFFKKEGFNVFTSSLNQKSDFPLKNCNFKLKNLCIEKKINILLQVENLDKREFIFDLNKINCTKIFYAIDVHLNYYWQKYYALNFDVFISSQYHHALLHKKYFNQPTFWLPWGINDYLIADEFIPFKERKYDISFIGIIDNHRIKRKNIINFFKKNFNIFTAGTDLNNRISLDKMIDIYKNSKIVINESIHNEVNFRYFEATGAGALLFTEEINNGENLLFKENLEFIKYNQENIIKKLKNILKNIEHYESIAKRGYHKTKEYFKFSNKAKIIKKIIEIYNKNSSTNNIINSSDNIPLLYSCLLTLLRGIGIQEYLPLIETYINTNKNIETNLQLRLIQLSLLSIKRPDLSIKFLENLLANKYENIIFANLVKSLYENKNEKKLIYYFSQIFHPSKQYTIFKFFVKLVQKLFKEEKEHYYIGFLNQSNIKIIFNTYDLISFIFNSFKNEAEKDIELNFIASLILIKNENYIQAIQYLLNIIRDDAENLRARKLLKKCYYKIYDFDMYYLEKLKILILEKQFSQFKKINIPLNLKKEAILDIIEQITNKKLIRDITIYLESFFN